MAMYANYNSSVFRTTNGQANDKEDMFFGRSVDVARYEQPRFAQIDKITEKQIGFFWTPDEVDLTKDRVDFISMLPHEKEIFTLNLQRQIMLDSIQGRGIAETFFPVISVPELEPLVAVWSFMETLHSRSYTHIIRNVYPDPSLVFDQITEQKEIVACAEQITEYYDSFIFHSKLWQLFGEGSHEVNGKRYVVSIRDLKEKLWLCLHAINVLEGIRFYVSFACSWAFAELNKMEGNAKIIKLIARDENLHLAATQTIIKLLLNSDPEFVDIKQQFEPTVQQIFLEAIDQERQWCDRLFQEGSIIGLNGRLLRDYVEWIGSKRFRSLHYSVPYHSPKANPLPWTEKWISGQTVQVAPQETEISSYVIGGVQQDISKTMLKNLTL